MPLIEDEYYDNISAYWAHQGLNNALQEREDKDWAEHDRESYCCELCGREISKESDVFMYGNECLCQNCFEALDMDMEG